MNYYSNSQTININNTSLQRNGGYIGYWKLTFQLWLQYFEMAKVLSFRQRVSTFSVLLLKTPYWLILKPLFKVFSVKTTMKGSCTWSNDRLIKNSIKKFKTIRFLAIPIFGYSSSITDEEWKKIRR